MINIIDLIFLNFAFFISFTGYLINNYEKYVPAFVIKSYKYGSFAYQGSDANYLRAIEIPKAYYKHFYLFSSIFGLTTLSYMILVYFFEFSMNMYVKMFLKFLLEEDEPAVSVFASLLTTILLSVQCLRRFYETHYLQVFAKSSKMNLSHYLVGIMHYFACVVAVAGQAPLFCGNQNRDTILWSDRWTKAVFIPCVITFFWAWHEQYKTNVIFANLRKDKKSGEVMTEDHSVPHGRLFVYVSSPHRMCEIIIYTTLFLLVPTKTYFCIYLWVLANQFQTAFQAHDWYRKSFKNYPTDRRAVIPHII